MATEWLNIQEAASYLKMSLSKMQKLTAKRNIPGYKNGGSWLFKAYELDNWITKGGEYGFEPKQYPEVYKNWQKTKII